MRIQDIKLAHLYRNVRTRELYLIGGVYPHIKNAVVKDFEKEFIIVLFKINDDEKERVLEYITFKEWATPIKHEGKEVNRFILIQKKEPIKLNTLEEYDEIINKPESKIKKIKFL